MAQSWNINYFLIQSQVVSSQMNLLIKTAESLHAEAQLLWENSDECEPGFHPPTYYAAVQRTSPFPWLESQKVLLCFSISPHNEGNNKHGCNNVPVQIRSGRGGVKGFAGVGERLEGEPYLKIHFHVDLSIRAITVKSFFSETEICCRVIGETSSVNSAGRVFWFYFAVSVLNSRSRIGIIGSQLEFKCLAKLHFPHSGGLEKLVPLTLRLSAHYRNMS